MEQSNEGPERRRFFRISVSGTALLWNKDQFAGNYLVGNLSAGGCLLSSGPVCELGQKYDIKLHMQRAPIVFVQGIVVRQGIYFGNGNGIGIRFSNRTENIEDMVHDLALVSFEQMIPKRAAAVLVLHPHEETRNSIVTALERMGYNVVPADTPLAAIWALENSDLDIHTAIVSRFIGELDGGEMMEYLAMHYPQIRRILAGGETVLPLDHASSRAHVLLSRPWEEDRLRLVLPLEERPQKKAAG